MIQETKAAATVEQYCELVLSGDVAVCKTTIQAVERYLDDREREIDPEFPYSFDEDAAKLACLFFPMLLRHSIGEWAGNEFELLPWQTFVVWNLFGWKRKDGRRRFRKAFLTVARKNGKSTFCSGLAIMLAAADDEEGAQVFIGATKLDQAKIIFDESKRMLQQSPHIAKHATIHKTNVAFESSNSFIRPLGSDKPFDGLNPHATFFDELHAWKEHHRSFYDTMSTGSGSRTQPLQVTITTAGDEKSLIYHEEANYARGVLAGDFKDEALFAMVFELDKEDDPFDPEFEIETLCKSNPSLGYSVKYEYLEQQLKEARNKPQAKNRFLRYHGNVCVTSVEEAMSAEIWDAAKGPLSDWMQADGVGAGVDLGGRDDLAAYGLSAKFKTGEDKEGRPLYRYEGRSKAFIAKDTKRDLSKEPFATWINEGKLIICEYVLSTLREYLIEDCQALGVEFVAYDPYQAAQLAEELTQEGLKPVKMPQSHGHFNETINNYLDEISEGRFTPDETDDVLRWCALNMALNRNAKDQVMPDKNHSKEKIDAIVSYLMARRACNLALPRTTGSLIL